MRENISDNAAVPRSETPTWWAWRNMRKRCLDPKTPYYKNYGGRGITVCPEWAGSYAAFFAAVGVRPSPKHSLDRIDNERGYEPGNVRWATRAEQFANRRTTVRLTAYGITMTLGAWAAYLKRPYMTLYNRYFTYGWSPERTVDFSFPGL